MGPAYSAPIDPPNASRPQVVCLSSTHPQEPTMTTFSLTQKVATFALSSMVTLVVMISLHGLAAPDAHAVQQLVAAASAAKA